MGVRKRMKKPEPFCSKHPEDAPVIVTKGYWRTPVCWECHEEAERTRAARTAEEE